MEKIRGELLSVLAETTNWASSDEIRERLEIICQAALKKAQASGISSDDKESLIGLFNELAVAYVAAAEHEFEAKTAEAQGLSLEIVNGFYTMAINAYEFVGLAELANIVGR